MAETATAWSVNDRGQMKCNVNVSDPASAKHAMAVAARTVPEGFAVEGAFKYGSRGWYNVRAERISQVASPVEPEL